MNTILIQDVFCCLCQINSQLTAAPLLFNYVEADNIAKRIKMVSENIKKEFPYFSERLISSLDNLFGNTRGGLCLNLCAFGQIYEIFLTLKNINNFDVWNLMHPMISEVSKSLYLDGHYAEASLKAFVAINQRMKEIHKIQCPQEDELDGVALMNTMFSDKNPKIEICSRDTETGKNIHMGTRFMLAGAMSALRNPQAHEIIKLSPDDAIRRLMFASMLMFKIDEAVEYSNIQEK